MNNVRKFIFPLTVTCMLLLLMMGCKKHETYIVTFNANGGTGTMEAQTFTDGEAQALTRNAFTYDGYTFTGWNTVQGGSGASYSDQQTIIVTSSMTLYAQWTSNGSNPAQTPQRHEYVDLGLPSGIKWATCNVGANNPEEYGDYFAWGETATKEIYNWSTYRYCNGGDGYNTLTKYCNNSEYGNNGFTDNLITLEASDDAATANWGAGWRMPTETEMRELVDNCTVTCTTQNGVNGNLFTGPNGNSIFLPAAGLDFDVDDPGDIYAGDGGAYWSSSLLIDYNDPNEAIGFLFTRSYHDVSVGGFSRAGGLSVRPVYVN